MLTVLKHEIRVFFTALMFYTRIPCPGWVDHSDSMINKSTRYFSLIGYIVGGIASLSFLAGNFFFGFYPGIVLSLIASVLTTGAFHEDGLADTCDGFGGGWTKEKILTILKDSRIGAYGAIALILLFALKLAILSAILPIPTGQYLVVFLILISGHSMSRFFASTLIYWLPYARETDDGKAKPVAESMSITSLIFSFLIAILPFLLLGYFTFNYWTFLSIGPLYVSVHWLGKYFKKWIGGYTGDCLGAAQQIAELVFYFSIVAIWKFT
jgi:adenosylcobinamide-GDP ribazoletransferase